LPRLYKLSCEAAIIIIEWRFFILLQENLNSFTIIQLHLKGPLSRTGCDRFCDNLTGKVSLCTHEHGGCPVRIPAAVKVKKQEKQECEYCFCLPCFSPGTSEHRKKTSHQEKDSPQSRPINSKKDPGYSQEGICISAGIHNLLSLPFNEGFFIIWDKYTIRKRKGKEDKISPAVMGDKGVIPLPVSW
jgi:hypothetical protein